MRKYLLKLNLSGMRSMSLPAAAARAGEAAEEPSNEARRAHYLRSMFVPEDETRFHRYEAASADAAAEASRRAALPIVRVVEAVLAPAEDARPAGWVRPARRVGGVLAVATMLTAVASAAPGAVTLASTTAGKAAAVRAHAGQAAGGAAAAALISQSNSPSVPGRPFVAFGPQNYLREAGKPDTVTSRFSVLNTNTDYTLRLDNGGLEGQFEKVSSAVVTLNGTTVVGPSDFNQAVAVIEKPVTLLGANELLIELRSRPGGGIALRVIGIDTDLPTVAATVDPAPNAAGWHKTDVTVRFACSDATSGVATCPEPVTVTTEGANQVVSGAAVDRAGHTATASVSLNIDRTAPSVAFGTPTPAPNAAGWHNTDVSIPFTVSDSLSGIASTTPADGSLVLTTEGAAVTGTVEATDLAGNPASAASPPVKIDKTPPTVAITSPADGEAVPDATVAVSGTVEDSLSGVAGVGCNGAPGAVSGSTFTCEVLLPQIGSNTVTAEATDVAGNADTASIAVTRLVAPSLPPDPAETAPPVEPGVASSLADSTAFLYTGGNPIQTGVAPGTIEPRRAAVLRGQVLTRAGEPLDGVGITVLDHPEFGRTLSRADGMFDLAVNGGGLLTVEYEKDGFLTAQRQVEAPWQDYARLEDVVLVPLDALVTTIDLSASADVQVARGSEVTDNDGTRRATLVFKEGTSAEMVLPDGSTQPLTTLHVRTTEYTVGENGPEAMPAQLPPPSAYTYAVEFSVDEAVAAGAVKVRFSKPVVSYLENFLGFPTGMPVPVGFYDRERGEWLASDNGRVVKIASESDGKAELNVDEDPEAEDAGALAELGIDEPERRRLAALYEPGQSLWRVPIAHFSPKDFNWPQGLPPGARPPNTPPPGGGPPVDCPSTAGGSVIRCEPQTLGESVGITGTPFSLNYVSDRTPGRTDERALEIPLSGATVPDSLSRIDLVVDVAGRRFEQSFTDAPNQNHTFHWDGKDAYGRTLQGSQPVTVSIGYVYPAVYEGPGAGWRAFARFGNGLDQDATRREYLLWQKWDGSIGAWDARGQGLGGWSLNVHHAYDRFGRVLHLGDGGQRSATAIGQGATIETFLRTSPDSVPQNLAVGADGSVYFSDTARVYRVDPDGTMTRVAGSGLPSGGDGGPATEAGFSPISGLALASDGTLYISENAHRVRRVTPDGIITTVAGTGIPQGGGEVGHGDGGPATEAKLSSPRQPALGRDGSLYFVDRGTIRRVSPEGTIMTVAGWAEGVFEARSVAVAPDGTLYIQDGAGVRRLATDGVMTTVIRGPFSLRDVSLGPDGSLYLVRIPDSPITRIDPEGRHTPVAGGGSPPDGLGDRGPATQGRLHTVHDAAFGPDGTLYIAESRPSDVVGGRIRAVRTAWPGYSLGDSLIPAADGSELYVFDPLGRHLDTLDPLTGARLYSFSYDGENRLTAVEDGDGNVTTVERNADGSPSAIVAPFGQRTALSLNDDGYLATITNPAGESHEFTYSSGGLLTGLTDLRGNAYAFGYDELGRLVRDEDPAGGVKTLSRTDSDRGYKVTLSTALGRSTTYEVERLPTGETRRRVTDPSGAVTEVVVGSDGSRRITYPDGTRATAQLGPDPRWGMLAPVVTSSSVTTPSGLVRRTSAARSVALRNTGDLLSLQTQSDTVTVNGRLYTSAYDAATRTITDTTPAGRKRTTVIDGKGRVVREQVDGLAAAIYTYDASGHLATLAQGTGQDKRTTSLTYDPDGFLATITDPLGRTARFAYDAAGRLTRQTTPDERVIAYTSDAGGNLTAVAPPGRPAHTFSYTPVNLMAAYTPPTLGEGSTQTQYAYDADRQLTHVTRPDGQLVDFGYDSAGRLASLTLPRGQVALAYEAGTGNPASITAPGGLDLTYGSDGALLISETWSGAVPGSLTRSYDSDLRVTSLRVNGTGVAFSYDADNLLTQAASLALTRDSQNGLVTGTALGGVTDAWSYNRFGEPTSYAASHAGSVLLSVQYTRDPLGRITQRTETVGGSTATFDYAYDVAGRLIEVRKNAATTNTYSYDSNGNRVSATGPDGAVSGTYDAQDRLLRYGAATYTYTASGDLRAKTVGGHTTTYTYDALGNLTAVDLPQGTQVEYLIEGRNRRVGKRVNGALVQGFLYEDQLRPSAELDGAGNVVSRFVYGSRDNVPDYLVKGDTTYRIIADHLGSPRLIVDAATGLVVQRLDYDAFGNVTRDTNPGFQPFGFAGGIYDTNTKLVRFGARDYDAEVGRWTAKDPILFAGGDSNLYGYVGNDPVNFVDPTGTISICKLACVAVVAAAGAFTICKTRTCLIGVPLVGEACKQVCEEPWDTAIGDALYEAPQFLPDLPCFVGWPGGPAFASEPITRPRPSHHPRLVPTPPGAPPLP